MPQPEFPRGEILRLFLRYADVDIRTDKWWDTKKMKYMDRATKVNQSAQRVLQTSILTLVDPAEWHVSVDFPANAMRVKYWRRDNPYEKSHVLVLSTYDPLNIREPSE